MLTPTLACELIHHIPKCQMETLGLTSWKCGDSYESHSHTVFGNRIVKDGKAASPTEGDCKVSLYSVLMKEEVFKDAIVMKDWTCFDPKYKQCFIHQEDSCKQCKMDKRGRYCTIIDAWTTLAAAQCKLPKEGCYEDSPLAEIIGVIISPHHRSYTGLCFPNAWDPIRPLKLDDNDEVKLKSLYDTPVECGCDYEIPMLKNLPKPKKK